MSGPQPTPYPIEPEKNWFRRHLLLPIVAAIAIAGFLLVGAIAAGVLSLIKSSDVYQQAVTKVQNSPAALEALGKPVVPGWWLSGSINVSGSSGSADIAIPVSGPKAKGTVYAVASKRAGRWQFQTLELEVEGQSQRIPLIPAQTDPQPRLKEQ
jgi:hypothetical protein